MFRIKAFTKKGTKFRFRIKSNNVQELQTILDQIFAGRHLRMILVEPVEEYAVDAA